MFDSLSEKLQGIFKELRKRGKLNEADVDAAMREIRLVLLEADVHYSVAKSFIARVRERAVGVEVAKSLTPGQQVVKIVHEELVQTLGGAGHLNLSGNTPHVILLLGLQGSGKTTFAAKLALHLRRHKQIPMMVAADTYRPAAIEQLVALGRQIDVPVYSEDITSPPTQIAVNSVQAAIRANASVVIIDSAGRLQIDPEMMGELVAIRDRVRPKETLLVADSMTGQEAVNIAQGFNEQIGITGLVLTKIDGDARGGAAISMREVTGVPIKFLGTSEKMDGLEVFDPDRLARRILQMGDVLGLIERAEALEIEEEEALEMAEKLRTSRFTLEDLHKQLQQAKRLGPLTQIMEMIPGLNQSIKHVSQEDIDRQLKLVEAIINSMTPEEKRHPKILDASRRKRIAAGSGTSVQDINQLIKQFQKMQQLMKQLSRQKMPDLKNLFGQ
ncbi:MAG: signal recognition particle protein [Anaerolineae bacterium]|nr:signal recognition particle protein [Anaerolineae bacterium]